MSGARVLPRGKMASGVPDFGLATSGLVVGLITEESDSWVLSRKSKA